MKYRSGTLSNAIGRAHFVFTAYQWPLLVDHAHQCVSIQRSAPAIVQPCHGLSAPLIDFDIVCGHAGIGEQHDFQPATAGFAAVTAYDGQGWFARFVSHNGQSIEKCRAGCGCATNCCACSGCAALDGFFFQGSDQHFDHFLHLRIPGLELTVDPQSVNIIDQ